MIAKFKELDASLIMEVPLPLLEQNLRDLLAEYWVSFSHYFPEISDSFSQISNTPVSSSQKVAMILYELYYCSTPIALSRLIAFLSHEASKIESCLAEAQGSNSVLSIGEASPKIEKASPRNNNIDARGIKRGKCSQSDCDCEFYERPTKGFNCEYCGHPSPQHEKL